MEKLFYIFVLTLFLCACADENNYAPVTDVSTIEHVPKHGTYRVLPGETLYSIAWRYGLDYRYLASINHIAPPFHVVAGQRIYLKRQSSSVSRIQTPGKTIPASPIHSMVVRQPVYQPIYAVDRDASKPVALWNWPAHGPIVGLYSTFNKGINIGGQMGNPVFATAAGQVVYNGSGLRGYGHLVIIKHNNTYLSAYAHNSLVLVREGQRVHAGQEIAEMGHTASGQAMLHFEIRRNGQPVNPLSYLQHR